MPEHPTDPVVLEGVSVTVPRRTDPVLVGVDLRVRPGEHVLLLGPSGSGKSTVLHCITGVVPHTVTARLDGEVTVAGTRTADAAVVDLSRHVAVVAQDPAAAVCLPTVDQEVALPLENHATDPSDIGPRVDSVLATVGARHLRERVTGELSGGEAQRVALAAALVTAPDVLLLDEPTSMLDPEGVADVRRALEGASSRPGTTVVLVEHRLDDLAGEGGPAVLPGRAVVLDEGGRVVADGATDQVLHDHAGALLRAGCWLPLDAELRTLSGGDGGLVSPASRDLLRQLAQAPDAVATAGPATGEVALRTRGLAVARHVPARRRRRTAGPLDPPPLLAGVDLELRTGEVVALLGRNGVGKTSLLLTLAGLLRPAAGTVEGERAGMVFQNAEHQFVAHTVAEEIAHGLTGPVDEVVERQLRAHRLEHLAGQSPFRLSGGEKRRLSLAAMLAHERPCLFADEPTLGLDRRDTIATTTALRAAADAGRAVVVSSHDLRTVVTVADRVVVLGEGGVVADGPTVPVLRDAEVRRRGGLTLPPLVAWLLEEVGEPAAVRRALLALDAAVSTPTAPVEAVR
ncbi:energy-coupling factor transport system ATP-binding protein [Georgenia satyanarayanai]|uniref:Energy-coupling factor transport system ATP-binding protein n=1 Tax=Georgenia satyanarayanai TaxID=860221 RepID=A0A2Y9BZQ0_9MICO|nr:ABC transporter ATP-binding protein [Georgenia satyanarayanai]PYF98914.1 energy-coupling factor transport system ATP-binding protein [Georgenia satyanarayanai]SSA44762.1 energy-coupling factor transport system ATP-binding protein [Georgenia satyanarayanai]